MQTNVNQLLIYVPSAPSQDGTLLIILLTVCLVELATTSFELEHLRRDYPTA